jgi:hypothetical protein
MDDDYCDEDDCVAGCSCRDGELLNDYGECVPAEQCTCYDAYDPEHPMKNAGDISKRGCADWLVS